MGNPPDSDRNASESSTGPGHRLGKARAARQLTIDAVAAQLRVDAKVIDALERDDYAHLPSAVFVRGYLRAYARLVDLPAEPLIEAFDRRTTQAPPPLVLPTAIGPDIEPRRGYARWLMLAFALLALALFYQWWRSEETPPAESHSLATVSPVPTSVPASPAPAAPAGGQAIAEPTPAVPATAPGMPLENLYDSPADESVTSSSTSSSTPANKSASPATLASKATTVSPTPATPTSAASVAGGAADLVLQFKADSWVVVRDATGRALLQGVGKSGSRHVLQGKPPLQVTLGNSPAVEVEYRGQRFDQSRYNAPSRIARFTLGSP